MNDNLLNDINLNFYRTFYIVAKSKSIVEAADKMLISQSGVSKAIKNLEETLGTKLFYRNNTGIDLTKDGIDLFRYVESSYNNLIAGQKVILENQDLERGTLVIGAPSHIASFYLLKYVKRFRRDYPGVNIKIISASTSQLIEELLQHKIDFIIDSSPVDEKAKNIEIEPLTILKTCFIVSQSIKLEEGKNIEDFNYILPHERSSIRKNLEKQLRKNDVNLSVVLEVETTELIVEAVKKDIGVGYVIKEAVTQNLENNELFEFKIDYELPELEINLIYIKSYLSKVTKNFISNYIKK